MDQDDSDQAGGEGENEVVSDHVCGRGEKKLMAVQNMMEHKVIVEGEPQRQPKQGDTIQYLNNKGGWEKVKITNRVSRKSGYVNVQKEEGDQRGFDLPTGS